MGMVRGPIVACVAACVVLVAACAGVSRSDVQRLVAFVEDGRTTRADLREALGPPSREYLGGSIWTYSGGWWLRLGDGTLRYRVRSDEDARYHLVVVFGENDVVRTHRIVALR